MNVALMTGYLTKKVGVERRDLLLLGGGAGGDAVASGVRRPGGATARRSSHHFSERTRGSESLHHSMELCWFGGW